MTTKNFWTMTALATTCALASLHANATVTEDVSMTFSSGATFSGEVTMANDFSSFVSVDGTLSGGNYGTEAINTVYSTPWVNSLGSNEYGNFIGNTASNDWLLLTVDYQNPQQLEFASGGTFFTGPFNAINYSDSMTSGSISGVSAVPESSPLAMLVIGLAVLGYKARSRTRSQFNQAPMAHA